MYKTEITKTEPLNPGDVIEIVYKTTGWVLPTAIQLAAIENKLLGKEEKGWVYEAITWSRDEKKLYIRCKIIKTNPIAVTAGLIITSLAIILGGLLIFLTFDRIYKITESPAGSLSISLVLGILILLVLKGLKL